MDTELLASIIASTPVPPLPQLVSRGDDCVDSTCSSHDTLASMLIHATQLNDMDANEKRKHLQMKLLVQYQDLFRNLLEQAVKLGAVDILDMEKVIYNTFCSYTREHIATYIPKNENSLDQHLPDLRFIPHDIACSYKHGSSLFDRTHQHLCALIDILNTENKVAGVFPNSSQTITKPIPDQTSYDELLYMYAKLVWV
jgi:hypothetical protein